MARREGDNAGLKGAGHQAPQRIVALLLGEEAVPEEIMAGAGRRSLRCYQGAGERGNKRSSSNGTLNQTFGFKIGVGVADCGSMHP